MKTIHAYVTIGNPKGVHGRVATRLAEIARDYDLAITLARNDISASASSILDVLSMALVCGTFVCITLKGGKAVEGLPLVYDLLVRDDHYL